MFMYRTPWRMQECRCKHCKTILLQGNMKRHLLYHCPVLKALGKTRKRIR